MPPFGGAEKIFQPPEIQTKAKEQRNREIPATVAGTTNRFPFFGHRKEMKKINQKGEGKAVTSRIEKTANYYTYG